MESETCNLNNHCRGNLQIQNSTNFSNDKTEATITTITITRTLTGYIQWKIRNVLSLLTVAVTYLLVTYLSNKVYLTYQASVQLQLNVAISNTRRKRKIVRNGGRSKNSKLNDWKANPKDPNNRRLEMTEFKLAGSNGTRKTLLWNMFSCFAGDVNHTLTGSKDHVCGLW